MFAAPLLAAGLIAFAPQPHPSLRPSLLSQSQSYAITAAVRQDTSTPRARKDNKWDGALGGVVAGGAAGAVSGLIFYGKGGGEWPSQGEFMGATTLFGALAGGVIGLAIDLIKR